MAFDLRHNGLKSHKNAEIFDLKPRSPVKSHSNSAQFHQANKA